MARTHRGRTVSPRRDRPSLGLRLPPTPEPWPRLPYYAFHPFGVERRRAELIRRVAARAAWFEAIVDAADRGGLRSADRDARDRPVDRRRGRRPGARRVI